MSADLALVVVAGLGLVVVLGSRAIRHLPVSEPAVALLIGVVLGPEVLAVADFDDGLHVLHVVSELSMAVALMAVALRFPWRAVRSWAVPLGWLLAVGMLAMAAIVTGLAAAVAGVGLATAVLIGAILTPTDPVLASSVVTGDPAVEALPERLRGLLSIESGFNDGLALPLVVAGMAMVQGDGLHRFGVEGLWSVVLGLLVGWLIGEAAGRAFRVLDEHRDVEDSAFFVFTLVLALFALGAVNSLGGDGVLAVFVTGLAYNRAVGESIYEDEREVEEGINRTLVLPVFLLFGTLLPWGEWADLSPELPIFAVGVLVLRRIPVVLVLRPLLGLSLRSAAFLGWFGPMGVAALFFVTSGIEKGIAEEPLWPIVALVVAASTIVHGVTAAPGRRIYEAAGHRS